MHLKMWSNLTIKRGDSGSALMLGEKCVITEAPNLDKKSDKNWSKSSKSEKWENQEKWKSDKNTKTVKSKIIKNDKMQNQKSEKSDISEKGQKCPKWQING